jgi:hypothetical protein
MYTHSVSESYSEIPAPRTTEKASLTNIVPKTLCSRFPIELIVSLIYFGAHREGIAFELPLHPRPITDLLLIR